VSPSALVLAATTSAITLPFNISSSTSIVPASLQDSTAQHVMQQHVMPHTAPQSRPAWCQPPCRAAQHSTAHHSTATAHHSTATAHHSTLHHTACGLQQAGIVANSRTSR
jgi:hypothetical protein